MVNIQEIRKKYPMYEDLSDQELASKLHQKYYSDMPQNDFYSRVGVQPSAQLERPQQAYQQPEPQNVVDYLKRASQIQSQLPMAQKGQQLIQEELKRRGNQSLTDKLLNDINTRFGQGLMNSLTSIANVPSHIVNTITGNETIPRIPHQDLSYLMSGEPLGEMAGGIGSFAGGAVLPIGTYGKTAQVLSRLPGNIGALTRTGAGALSGYLTGETPEGERGTASAWGGLFGATLPNVGQVGSKIASGIHEYKLKPLKKAGKEVLRDTEALTKEAQNIYGNFFEQSREAGANNIFRTGLLQDKHIFELAQNPQHFNALLSKSLKEAFNYKALKEGIPNKYMKSFRKFLKNDSMKNAHFAASDLKKGIASLNSERSLTAHQNNAIRVAEKAVKKIENEMERALRDSNNPELAGKLKDINTWYGKEVAPLKYNKHIVKYGEKKLTEEGLAKALAKDQEFQRKVPSRHRNIEKGVESGQIREDVMNFLRKGALMGLGGGAAAGIGYPLMRGLFNRE